MSGDQERRAQIDFTLAQIELALAQHDRARQEIRFAPWLAMISGMTAGAAIFAAAAAFLKLLGN
jgi:hypothetical protein